MDRNQIQLLNSILRFTPSDGCPENMRWTGLTPEPSDDSIDFDVPSYTDLDLCLEDDSPFFPKMDWQHERESSRPPPRYRSLPPPPYDSHNSGTYRRRHSRTPPPSYDQAVGFKSPNDFEDHFPLTPESVESFSPNNTPEIELHNFNEFEFLDEFESSGDFITANEFVLNNNNNNNAERHELPCYSTTPGRQLMGFGEEWTAKAADGSTCLPGEALSQWPMGERQRAAMEESEFPCAERSAVYVPADPEEWSESAVAEWARWAENCFGTGPLDRRALPADGTALCLLAREDFRRIARTQKGAEDLHNHLTYLRRAAGHVIDFDLEKKSSDTSVQPSSIETLEKENQRSVKECIYFYFDRAKAETPTAAAGGGQVQLWQFLLEVLFAGETALLQWRGEDGEFLFVDPEEVARRWGERKKKEGMTYETMSRSLRYYYDKMMMSKVSGQKYAYKFLLPGLLKSLQNGGISDAAFITPGFVQEDQYSLVRNFSLTPPSNTSV